MSVFPTILKRLLSVYDKRPNSNISKILNILANQLDRIYTTLDTIEEWSDIDKAQGTTLDLIGKGVGQQREGLNDIAYRTWIKSKYLRDRSDGRINTIISNLSYLFNKNETDLLLKKGDEPASLYSEYDLSVTEETGLSVDKIGEISNSITASGVSMDIYFQGSFLFASEYEPATDEFDADHGFGEVVKDDDEFYHKGDFALGSIDGTAAGGEGLATDDMGVGGQFGAMYTTEKIRAW